MSDDASGEVVVVWRTADSRWPWLWDSDEQPARRWHGAGEGPAHYFATTPDGAWAEFLRHEEIFATEDLEGIDRGLWAARLPYPSHRPALDDDALFGGRESYPDCQTEARRLREEAGAPSLVAPSAALLPGHARAYLVVEGHHQPVDVDSEVVVLYGPPDELQVAGWLCSIGGRPDHDLPTRVRYL